jgi:hypothetical protein
MFYVLATANETIVTVASIIGVCAVFVTLFIIISNHANNDQKHLKEGETPMTLQMCDQVHKGWQQCVTILAAAVKSNEERATESVRELKKDISEQNKQVLASIHCLESKVLTVRQGE